jgi:hypothetical protein
LGLQTGYYNKGHYNIFHGQGAGYMNTDGSGNIFIGTSAGYSSSGNNNVFIGHMAGYNQTGPEKLVIENSNKDSTGALIWGNFNSDLLRFNANVGIGRMSASNKLEVEGTASKTTAGDWLANSDRRIKTDIQDIDNAFAIVSQLHPVKFKYSKEWRTLHPSIKDQFYYNFIAQEYKEVFPESVKGSEEYIKGDEKEILQLDSYNAQIVTIKAVQELIKKNQEQKKELRAQNEIIHQLKETIKKIYKMLENK